MVPLAGTPEAGQAPAARRIVAVPGAEEDVSGEATVKVTVWLAVCAEHQPIHRPSAAKMAP